MRAAALLAITLLFAPLFTQANDSAQLALDQALVIGLSQHYSILGAKEELVRLEGQITEVRSQVLPQLGVEATAYAYYDESNLSPGKRARQSDFYQAKLTGSQLLFSWGKATSAIDAAKIERQRALKTLSGTELQVKLYIHEAFYDLLLAHRLVEVSTQQIEQRTQHLEVAQKRFDAGVSTEFEVIRSRAQLANAKLPLIKSKNRIKQAEARLNHLLGRAQTTPIEPVGELKSPGSLATTLDELINSALANRPELQAVRLQRRSAEKELTIYGAQNKPSIHAFGEYGTGASHIDDLGDEREQWNAGVLMTFPFFDGMRTSAQVSQAESKIRSTDIAIEDLEQQITLEARTALDTMNEALQLVDASKAAIAETTRALEMARISYENGVATTLDVTDAEVGLTSSLTNQATAMRDLLATVARVKAVAGEL
jgi:HAE1 family hydrophobic/amphiphilic exporter-1